MTFRPAETSSSAVAITRREALQSAAVFGVGLFSRLVQARPVPVRDTTQATSCILIWLQGGVNHYRLVR